MVGEFHYDRHPFEFADLTDVGALEASHPELLRTTAAGVPTGSRVLDLGSGPGRFTLWARRKGLAVAAMDRSLSSLLRLRSIDRGAPAVVGDVLQPPFRPCASLVVLDGVAHHTADPGGAVANAAALLGPKGVLYVAVYKRWGYYHVLYATLGAAARRCARRERLRWVVSAVRSLYRAAHSWRRGPKPSAVIDSLFADYFLTPRASFHSRGEVEGWADRLGLTCVAYDHFPAGNCHLFVFRRA